MTSPCQMTGDVSGGRSPFTLRRARLATTQLFEGDYEVFGDGRAYPDRTGSHARQRRVVVGPAEDRPAAIERRPVREPRESALRVRTACERADRADTLASMARIERILKRRHARLFIQHDPRDYAALPRRPNGLP